MNRSTFYKIRLASDRLNAIHSNPNTYKLIIPLLDEPYQLALEIMNYPDQLDDREVAKQVGCNWQTVKQVRRALEG